MDMKKKAQTGQIISIVQWVILVACGIFIPRWGWILPTVLFVIHLAEAFVYGIPKGKINGYTPLESLCLTWLYGFTWWKYLSEKK